MKQIITQKDPVDLNELLNHGDSDGFGCDVIFSGKVRNKSRGKNVSHIDYEIYDDMAVSELNKIADESLIKWDLGRCIIVHRHGRILTGEISIIIIVSSPHREDSYIASRYVIDEIKKRVPIWKKEFYDDGSEWISNRN